MSPTKEANGSQSDLRIPWFGVRRVAHKLAIQVKELRAERDIKSGQLETLTTMGRELVTEVKKLRSQRATMLKQMEELGIYTVVELENMRQELENQISEQSIRLDRDKYQAAAELDEIRRQMKEAQAAIVATDDLALLQEVGVYRYRHPLSDAVAYQNALAEIDSQIKSMVKKDGGAVLATTSWTVNSSASEGRKMVRDFSKLMLRAFNAEADNLVRGMKPCKSKLKRKRWSARNASACARNVRPSRK
jgi:hypothetical protein